MSSVFMYLDPFHIFGVYISSDMASFFYDQGCLCLFSELFCYYGPVKSGADNEIIIFFMLVTQIVVMLILVTGE